MNDNVTLTLAMGIAVSMVWERRTGLSCGGLISPGVLALSLNYPARTASGIVIAFVVWGLLELGVRKFCIYGRMRTGTAMLLALALRALTGHLSPYPVWFGWIVPGLIAVDMQRQGVVTTLASLFICSVTSAFAVTLVGWLWL